MRRKSSMETRSFAWRSGMDVSIICLCVARFVCGHVNIVKRGILVSHIQGGSNCREVSWGVKISFSKQLRNECNRQSIKWNTLRHLHIHKIVQLHRTKLQSTKNPMSRIVRCFLFVSPEKYIIKMSFYYVFLCLFQMCALTGLMTVEIILQCIYKPKKYRKKQNSTIFGS